MLLVMKKILIKFYSVAISFYNSLRFKSLHNSGSLIFLTKFKGIEFSEIALDNAILKQSCIHIDGKGNELILRQSYLWKVKIQIFGKNNLIEIEADAKLNLTTIVLRGNNCHIRIGKRTTFGSSYMVCMGEGNSITIGDECMFAENIEIWNTDSHPIFNLEGKIVNPSKPVCIGNHVWCGKGCKILKGVTIGDNAIVGMQSLVTKDIPAGTLNVGIPAKSIRENIIWNRHFITI